MPNFYTFPGSCAVQVLSGFNAYVPESDMGLEPLTQAHRLTMAVLSDTQLVNCTKELKRLGFRKLGTFNVAHYAKGKLHLFVAGGGFEVENEKEKVCLEVK